MHRALAESLLYERTHTSEAEKPLLTNAEIAHKIVEQTGVTLVRAQKAVTNAIFKSKKNL